MHYFGGRLQSSLLDPKWCLGVFHCISLTLCTLKEAKLVFKSDCTISGYQSCDAPVLLHWTQNSHNRGKTSFRAKMHKFGVPKLWSIRSTPLDPKCCLLVFHCISLTFCKLKDVKLVCKPACTILRYQSCESSVLLHRTENYVWEYFAAFPLASAHKRWKLVFEPECTSLGYQSCEASILVHWTQHYVL
jgi:hypothetical protein